MTSVRDGKKVRSYCSRRQKEDWKEGKGGECVQRLGRFRGMK